MSAVNMTFSGGDAIKEKLLKMAHGLEKAKTVHVGFLESATYASAPYTAQIASAAKRSRKEGRVWTSLLESWAKWGETHHPNLHIAQVAFWLEFGTSKTKARPFFRNMIRSKSPRWGTWLARYLKESDYDAQAALSKLGMLIKEQLQASILAWPADNKPLTVFIKRASKALVNFGTMLRHVDFQVLD